MFHVVTIAIQAYLKSFLYAYVIHAEIGICTYMYMLCIKDK